MLSIFLFIMSDPHVYPLPLQLLGNKADIGLTVVIGKQHPWFDDLGGTDKLLGCHRVGLVAGQEGNVDVLDLLHLGDLFGITRDIDAQAVERQDVAIVAALGVELQVPLGCVVSRYGLN